jgi:hypothetical protein
MQSTPPPNSAVWRGCFFSHGMRREFEKMGLDIKLKKVYNDRDLILPVD